MSRVHKIVHPEWASEIESTYRGLCAEAWRCDYTLSTDVDDETLIAFAATLRQYIIHAPGAHPYWEWYYMAGIALRDIPGAPPPNKQFDGASHELLVLSLDPRYPAPRPDGDFSERGRMHPLLPPDHIVQTMHVNDEQFSEMVDLFVRAVTDGMLSPDSDHRESWRRSMMSTTDHYRGLHD